MDLCFQQVTQLKETSLMAQEQQREAFDRILQEDRAKTAVLSGGNGLDALKATQLEVKHECHEPPCLKS